MIALRAYQRAAIDATAPKKIGKKTDHTGVRFGMLVARTLAPNAKNCGAQWSCVCDCGKEKIVSANNLVRGKAKSCGCASAEWRREHGQKHGHTAIGRRSGTYSSWHAMHQRCENPKHQQFADYGGRGITVCKRWTDFRNFLADMGERPHGLTIDRERANENYEPENCRWATAKEQSANQRPKVRNCDVIALLKTAKSVVSAPRIGLDTAIEQLSVAITNFENRRRA